MSHPSSSKKRKLNNNPEITTSEPPSPSLSPEKLLVPISKPTTEEPEDWTSSSGSESDNDSNPDSTNITKASTNITTPITTNDTTTNPIHTRLTSFFSQLAKQRANPSPVTDQTIETIEITSNSGSDSGFEDEDEDDRAERGPYIELDLALGVLSEKWSDGEEDGGIKVRLPGQQDMDDEEDGSEEGSDGQDIHGVGVGGLDELRDIALGGGTRKRRARDKGERKMRKKIIQEVE